MDFKIFYYTLSCILSRTYMCNVCAYVRMEIAAAKVRNIFDIYKCICIILHFFFILQAICYVLVSIEPKKRRKMGSNGCL